MSYKMTVSALIMAAAASAAMADDVTTLQTSGERMEANNAPMGIRAGAFLVIPKMDVKETYNDNIYSTQTNTTSDFVTTVAPEVAVKSNWSRHALNAKVATEINKFSSHSRENTTDTFVGMDGRLDVMRDTSVGGAFRGPVPMKTVETPTAMPRPPSPPSMTPPPPSWGPTAALAA